MKGLWLTGPAYELGERRMSHADVPDFSTGLIVLGLPPKPEFLGIGHFHKMEDLYGTISRSIAKTLERSELAAADIDAVLFCSSQFHHDATTQNRGYARVLQSQSIAPTAMYCVSGTGCVSLLSGLQLAAGLIAARGFRAVLVVNYDQADPSDDLGRICSHALLSDAVASVVLSSRRATPRDLCLQGYTDGTDASQMASGVRLQDVARGRQAIQSCAEISGERLSAVEKVFSNNIYLPMKRMKELSYGITPQQLYLSNVTRKGHCFSSDLLINLSDYLDERPAASGSFVFYSEAAGHIGCLLAGRSS